MARLWGNMRVIKWMFERTDGDEVANQSKIGLLPQEDAISLSELEISEEQLRNLLQVDQDKWPQEIEKLRNYFAMFGGKLPRKITEELNNLEARLKDR
jgi:phosphoenolpyruvate carboxykinase (GTP)